MESDLTEFSCLVKNCKLKFDDLFLYSRHLANYHSLPINIMYLKFKNQKDFYNSKANEEIINNCMFHQKTKKSLFMCHRNAYILSVVDEDNLVHKQDKDERHFKIKAPCPSHMKFELKNDEIHVMYVRTHYGYCPILRNHAISAETIEMVKTLAREGPIPESKIVDRVCKMLKDKDSIDTLITTKHVMEILNADENDK